METRLKVYSKKVLYFESITYILIIMLTIFLNINGSIYFRILPLLFLLGLIGEILFDRPIFTSLWGIGTSFLFITLRGDTTILINLIYSLYIGFLITMGEIFGILIRNIYYSIKDKLNIFGLKLISYYLTAIIILILALFSNNVIMGDIKKYETSKNTLDKYLLKNYNNLEEFKVLNSDYDFFKTKGYIFDIQNTSTSSKYEFIVYKNSNIYDEYKIKENERLEIRYQTNLDEYLKSSGIKEEFSNFSFKLEAELTDIILTIEKSVDNVDNLAKSNYVNDIIKIFEKLKGYNEYKNIIQCKLKLSSNENVIESILTNFEFEENYEYILKSFEVEYLGYTKLK